VTNEQSHLIAYSVDTDQKKALPGGPEAGSVAAWSADGRSLLVVEQTDAVARGFGRDLATGQREQYATSET
jgi:hypothetical protein